MKVKMFLFLVMLSLVLAGCASAQQAGGSRTGNDHNDTGNLSLLLRQAISEIQKWGDGNNARNVTVYSLDIAKKDELLQAVQDAGFYQVGSGEGPRDWDLQRGFLRWCVSPDTEKWDNELQFSAVGEKTVHTYFFKLLPDSPFAGLRAAVEIQRWGDGNDARDVTVYSFDPVKKDELFQAVKNAGFYQAYSGEYTRDWELQKGVLRWCVPSDTENWDWEIQFSAVGEKTVHTYGFIEGDDPSSFAAKIDNWDGATGLVEVGVPISLVGRGSPTAATWWWRSKGETDANAKETFVWRVKDDGGTGATINGNTINTTRPGTVTVTAVVPNGISEGKELTQDFILQAAGPKVTKGDYVVRQFQPGWLLDKYTGREGNVVIPASLEITIIGKDAFRESQITSVVIPEGVTETLSGAFWECRNLRTVTLPSTLRIIGSNTFRNCAFASINIPAGVTTIKSYAFSNCKNLTEITLPASLTTFEANPFNGCTGLTSITVQAVKPPIFKQEGGLWWDGYAKLSNFTAIYVPAASVDAYKNAKVWRWDDFVKFIKPIGK